VRFRRAVCKVRLADSVVMWQRDIGAFLSGGPSSGLYRVTHDHGVLIAHTTTARKSGTHPAITNGPLP
jgi:hypothetical protein